MVLLNKKEIKVGVYKTESLSKDMLLFNSQTCKIHLDEDNIEIRLKYSNSQVLGIYTVDKKNKHEYLCT